MSSNYSAYSATGQPPKTKSPTSPRGHDALPDRSGSRARKPVAVPGPAMQNGMSTAALAQNLSTTSPQIASNAWQTLDYGAVSSAPGLHSQAQQTSTSERSPYLTPGYSEQYGRPSASPARSPNSHVRSPSQVDTLLRQNADLQRELDEAREERDQKDAACENMLTELISTQETLEERETELQSLRDQLAQLQHHSSSPGGGQLSRNAEKELRELQLRCNRLQGECRRKDEQLQQAQAQGGMHQGMYGQSTSPAHHQRELAEAQQRLMDAESRANQAAQMHQAAQSQADKYAQQMHDWSVAYEGLKAAHTDLQHTHSQLKQTSALEQTRSREDGEAKAALEDVKRMRDFFQKNSDTVAKKNIEVTEQMRRAQDALHAKTREFEQQRGMLEAMQVQVQ